MTKFKFKRLKNPCINYVLLKSIYHIVFFFNNNCPPVGPPHLCFLRLQKHEALKNVVKWPAVCYYIFSLTYGVAS
jgi:hypothetical protein